MHKSKSRVASSSEMLATGFCCYVPLDIIAMLGHSGLEAVGSFSNIFTFWIGFTVLFYTPPVVDTVCCLAVEVALDVMSKTRGQASHLSRGR